MSLPDLQEPLDLLEQKDYTAAVEVLEQKVAALPAHLGAHVLLARSYEAQERWGRALEAWADAQFLMPNSPIVETGKRRVLRRIDGIEDGDEPLPLAEFPDPDAQPADPTTADASPEEEPQEREPVDEDDDSSSTEGASGLTELRHQAEREARQGGARPGPADDVSSADSSSSPEESATPEEQIERLEDEGDTDDLDRLIDKLQSARIDADPDAVADAPPPSSGETAAEAPDEDDPNEDDPGEVVSETLARIHEGQGDYEEAAHIYAQL
ncbi:MAG: hypothetical protein BRD30_01975, partial [Bacteroidetes bacterium QH_2_63_10]